MASDGNTPLKIIQWATGAQGTESIRAILDTPDYDLVGCKCYYTQKEGADAAELAGRHACGVKATTDFETILSMEADCVAYMPRNTSLDEVCALLESGKNVVTTAFLFYPKAMRPADLARLEAACEKGQSTIHGAGLNPGWISAVLPLTMSGMSRRVDHIRLQERADWSFYESTHITFDNMCFGGPLDQVSEDANDFIRFNSGIFKEMIWLLGERLNAGLEDVTAEVEVLPAPRDALIFERELKAGTVGAQRWLWSGKRGGKSLIEIETYWTVGGAYPDHWPNPDMGWTMTLEGEPSLRTHFLSLASFARDVPFPEHVRAASVATAMHALNAVPAVVAAPPGIATMADLPIVSSVIGFGNVPAGG
ncbi:MAG: dihydrodipicolinate reductase [Pseudomonadota bacterium]